MKLILKPKAPYDFTLHPRFFGFHKPVPEVYENGVWKRALRLESGKVVPLNVRMRGNVDKPTLEAGILKAADTEEQREIKRRLAWIFSADTDLMEPYAFMDKDRVLKKAKEKLYGLRPFNYSTVFEGVVKSIVQQQISLLVSMYMTFRLVEKFGDAVKVGKEVYYEFPPPRALAGATTDELKACGLSRQKAAYIKNFSEKVAKGEFDPEALTRLSSEEIIAALTQFKGIGRWTAELVIVTSTGKEALPADDLGAPRAVSKFFFGGRLISGDELRKFSERWGRFRGMVTYYLICAERLP